MSMKRNHQRIPRIIVVLITYYTTLEVVKILGHLIIVHPRLDGASQVSVVKVVKVRRDTTDGEVAVVDRAQVVKVGIIITVVDRVVVVHQVVGAHGHRVVRVERRDRDERLVSKEGGK